MKEGISYSFLLNIVILFIFVCAAIVGGILSYYRAFRANTAIINEIEKYEGYNCESKESIKKRLNSISYNLPFEATCKASYGTPCRVSDDGNYVVVAYNLDVNANVRGTSNDVEQRTKGYFNDDDMNSYVYASVESGVTNSSTKQYQFGVYTYMYADLPIISSILKIPFFSKTRILYEFRDLQYAYKFPGDTITAVDIDSIPSDIINSIDTKPFFNTDFNLENVDFDNLCETANGHVCDREESESLRRQLEEIKNSGDLVSWLRVNSKYFEEFKARIVEVNNQINNGTYIYDSTKWGKGNKMTQEYNLRDAYKYYGFNDENAVNMFLYSTRRCGEVRDWSVY